MPKAGTNRCRSTPGAWCGEGNLFFLRELFGVQGGAQRQRPADELRIHGRALSFERDDNNNVIGGEIAQLFAVPEPGSVVLMGVGAMLMLSRPSHVAVVDPVLTYALPPYLTAVTGLDALCQAVESLWSTRATALSMGLAEQALRLAVRHLIAAVNEPTPSSRAGMAQAAHLAGRAINISATTASHAMSYALTSRYGIPHGHAVALTLGNLIRVNSGLSSANATDERGAAHTERALARIADAFGVRDAFTAAAHFEQMMELVGCSRSLNVLAGGAAIPVEELANEVNPQRLANNPRPSTRSGHHATPGISTCSILPVMEFVYDHCTREGSHRS